MRLRKLRKPTGMVGLCVGLALGLLPTSSAWGQPCGPGPHWVDTCEAGTDGMPTSALLGIDLTLDCLPDTSLILSGAITVLRSDPLDDSVQFPGTRPVDEHLDVIDTEIRSMNLSGGGVTLRAGTDAGMEPLTATCDAAGAGVVPMSCGAIAEKPGDPTLADSFFDVWFEVDLGGGQFLYNQTALRMRSVITEVPPVADYMKVVGCLPLYDAPTGGTLVAYLTAAIHNTIEDAHVAAVEYSNLADEMAVAVGGAHNGLDPEQVLYTVPIDPLGPPFPFDSQDFGGGGEVDALANLGDGFFNTLWNGGADLLVSTAGDPTMPPGVAVYVETAVGGTGLKWAQIHLSNPDPAGDLDDLDGLELWGPFHDGTNPLSAWDANCFSLVGDAAAGTSVYFYPLGGPSVAYVPQATIVTAVTSLGFTGTASQVELDSLMVSDSVLGQVWDAGDRIMFSIKAAANWDGGEIVRLPFGGPASFLFHGAHLWDTAFGVGTAFGVDTEEVDAIEAMPPKGDFEWGPCTLVTDVCIVESKETCLTLDGVYGVPGTMCLSGNQSNIPDHYCGDGYCTDGENTIICCVDCGSSCGDGACNCGENSGSCPADCGDGVIPTVSEWAAIGMTLLLLVAGAMVFFRKRRAGTGVA